LGQFTGMSWRVRGSAPDVSNGRRPGLLVARQKTDDLRLASTRGRTLVDGHSRSANLGERGLRRRARGAAAYGEPGGGGIRSSAFGCRSSSCCRCETRTEPSAEGARPMSDAPTPHRSRSAVGRDPNALRLAVKPRRRPCSDRPARAEELDSKRFGAARRARFAISRSFRKWSIRATARSQPRAPSTATGTGANNNAAESNVERADELEARREDRVAPCARDGDDALLELVEQQHDAVRERSRGVA
jgi:hypothetical protein